MSIGGVSLIPTIIGVGVNWWTSRQEEKAREEATRAGIGYLQGATQYELEAKRKAYPEWWRLYMSEVMSSIGKDSPLIEAALQDTLRDIGQAEQQNILESSQYWRSQGMEGRGRGEQFRMRRRATRARREARFAEALGQEGFRATNLDRALGTMREMTGAAATALPAMGGIAGLLTSLGQIKAGPYQAIAAGMGDIVGTWRKGEEAKKERELLDRLLNE